METQTALDEIRTVTITSKGQVVLPKSARQKAGFSEGDKVVMITRKDCVVIVPIEDSEGILLALKGSNPLTKQRTQKQKDDDFEEFEKRVKSR